MTKASTYFFADLSLFYPHSLAKFL